MLGYYEQSFSAYSDPWAMSGELSGGTEKISPNRKFGARCPYGHRLKNLRPLSQSWKKRARDLSDAGQITVSLTLGLRVRKESSLLASPHGWCMSPRSPGKSHANFAPLRLMPVNIMLHKAGRSDCPHFAIRAAPSEKAEYAEKKHAFSVFPHENRVSRLYRFRLVG